MNRWYLAIALMAVACIMSQFAWSEDGFLACVEWAITIVSFLTSWRLAYVHLYKS